jgi:hypothetical protein
MAAVMVVVTAVVMGAMMGAVIACASRALEAVRCPRWRVPPSSRDSSASVASRGRSPRRASRKILNTRVRRDVARRSRRRLRHGCGSQRARAHSRRILRRTIRRHSGGGRRGTQRESERHARLERVEGPAPSERSESRGPAPSERSESRGPAPSERSESRGPSTRCARSGHSTRPRFLCAVESTGPAMSESPLRRKSQRGRVEWSRGDSHPRPDTSCPSRLRACPCFLSRHRRPRTAGARR